MNTLKFLVLCLLVAFSVSMREFRSKRERQSCELACSGRLSGCLTPNSACEKAYKYCDSQPNFVSCLQSANSLLIQEVVKCFESTCFTNQQLDNEKELEVLSRNEDQ